MKKPKNYPTGIITNPAALIKCHYIIWFLMLGYVKVGFF